MRSRYLIGNPWVGVSAGKPSTPKLDVGRSFSAKQWAFVEGQLEQLPDTGAARRLQFVMSLAYGTGLRLSELVNAKVSDLELVAFDAHTEGWVLKVLGKGDKLREVPIPDGLIAEVGRYLVQRGLDPDPRIAAEDAYLIGKIDDAGEGGSNRGPYDPKAGISASTLYDQLKRFFVECSTALALTDKAGAARIAQASTHWLRHTFGSHAVAAHTPLEVVQSVLGHASLNTTTIYVKAERKRRFQEMSRFWDEQMVARDRRRARF